LMDFDKNDESTYESYFYIGDSLQQFPHRWGYYFGYRIMQRIARHYTLLQIDHFDDATAHRLMTQELNVMAKEVGGCSRRV